MARAAAGPMAPPIIDAAVRESVSTLVRLILALSAAPLPYRLSLRAVSAPYQYSQPVWPNRYRVPSAARLPTTRLCLARRHPSLPVIVHKGRRHINVGATS